MTDSTESQLALDPSRTALLVMDFQRSVLQRLDDADALLDRAAAAISAARSRGVTVAYVRVALTESDALAVPPTNKMFSRLRDLGPMLTADSPGAAIDDRVAPATADIIVRKTRVGAFSTTDLDTQLRERRIDTLLLAGVSTSGVVLSTVRDAADRDYRLFVLADLCADTDPEVHAVLTERVFPRQADVIVSDALA